MCFYRCPKLHAKVYYVLLYDTCLTSAACRFWMSVCVVCLILLRCFSIFCVVLRYELSWATCSKFKLTFSRSSPGFFFQLDGHTYPCAISSITIFFQLATKFNHMLIVVQMTQHCTIFIVFISKFHHRRNHITQNQSTNTTFRVSRSLPFCKSFCLLLLWKKPKIILAGCMLDAA